MLPNGLFSCLLISDPSHPQKKASNSSAMTKSAQPGVGSSSELAGVQVDGAGTERGDHDDRSAS